MDRRGTSQDLSLGTDEITLLFAGHGGQGILLMGRVFAHAFILKGFEVSWLPSYGAEVRGGTCHCMVVISSSEVSCPYVFNPHYFIVMNQLSFDSFLPKVKSGAKVFYNETMISSIKEKEGIEFIAIPATELALEIGEIKIANMVMLGRLLREFNLLSLENVDDILKYYLKGKEKLLELDKCALRIGYSYNSKRINYF